MSRSKGWDIRVPVSVVHDPDYARLSPDAFTALILLQCMSARDQITDGRVAAKYYKPGPGYSGLPIVPSDRVPAALDELADVGLLEFDAEGVLVSWEHQTSRADLAKKREQDAARKRRQRAREREADAQG